MDNQRIAMRSGNKTANLGLTYLLGDHLGSTSVAYSYNLVTGSWDTTRQRYLPWGTVRFSTGALPTDYTFTGQKSEMDNLGLMFYVSRFYDSYQASYTEKVYANGMDIFITENVTSFGRNDPNSPFSTFSSLIVDDAQIPLGSMAEGTRASGPFWFEGGNINSIVSIFLYVGQKTANYWFTK